MIDVAGPYLLILMFWPRQPGAGIAMHEMDNFAACKAAIVQLEIVRGLDAICIAKNTVGDDQ
ncbi:hypothetical protein [Salipiger thiooxidans]|uniref:hypothetical protein n=1 Tax=Salipiger thiooxidans TaxID=282683 RepID=UPI001CD61A3C|nr:hypothetical protein [Salipiger thiooxidans]MCA0846104.1 hypothetical protein [Salipiger thiooxidans]